MNTCDNCPLPRRCLSAERCIVYKEDAVALENPEPTPVPIHTTFGIGMTGVKKKPAAKKAAPKKKAK